MSGAPREGAPRENAVRQVFRAIRTPGVTKFAPLAGLAGGAIAGAVYWLAVQLSPSSVALILSMLACALLTQELGDAAAPRGIDTLAQLFYVLLKYNVLMALSAAKLPFDAPPNTALCLIMICGYGAARSMQVCLLASVAARTKSPLTHSDLGLALLLGFWPALLLGMPGLIGLAAAVASALALSAAPRAALMYAPWIAETCFYLGAQASWRYI
jgi:cobalamin synthase